MYPICRSLLSVGFIKMFDPKTRAALVQAIQKITENAVNIEEMKG